MSLASFSPALEARVTRRAADLTGPENLLLLLPNPGDEIAYAGLLAGLCACGRPPVVAFLGDGAPGGSDQAARDAERASRAALALFGVPGGRFLFAGVPMAALEARDGVFCQALISAMTLLSWRKDCNVTGAGATDAPGGAAALDVARAVARAQNLPLLAGVPPGAGLAGTRSLWDLDAAACAGLRGAAAGKHSSLGREVAVPPGPFERFARIA